MALLALIPAAMAAAGAVGATTTVVAGMTAASAAVAAAGAIAAGNAQKASANYNAKVADLNAQQAEDVGGQREAAVRRNSAQELGKQFATIAQSGVDAGSGSALQIESQSATNAELDALNTRYGALTQAANFRNQATLSRFQGQTAQRNGYLSAGSLLAKSAASYFMPTGG